MAVCNIFNSLANTTGTFLTFSQYVEDLTQWSVKGSSRRVVPSKYVAVELNTENSGFSNFTLPKYLIDSFENGCAKFREQTSTWNAYNSAELFWDALFQTHLLSIDNDTLIVDGIKYVGDINLQSYDEFDGMGYAEIYCHIPNEACRKEYSLLATKPESGDNFDEVSVNVGDNLCGYIDGELNGREKLAQPYTYLISKAINDRFYTFNWNDPKNPPKSVTDKYFDINALIILYNIYGSSNELIAEDIPMGLYITGTIDDNNTITNSIRKYVSNEDIYNTGTSYGLRICSRFITSPYSDNYIVKEVTFEDNNYADLTKVLAKMSISQQKMDNILNKTISGDQHMKEVLSIFKNNRTNVPYIRTINGVNYWFVNGRMMNSAVVDNNNCDAYTETELDNLLGINQSLSVQISAVADGGLTVLDRTDMSEPKNVRVQWAVIYQGKQVDPDTITLKVNGIPQNIGTTNIIQKPISDDTTFRVECTYKNMSASSEVAMNYVYPVHIGGVSDSWVVSDVKLLKKYMCDGIDGLKRADVKVSTQNQYICIAYPKSFGPLEFITDESGFVLYTASCEGDHLGDHVNDFNRSEITLYQDTPYYVYVQRMKFTTESDYKLKFN